MVEQKMKEPCYKFSFKGTSLIKICPPTMPYYWRLTTKWKLVKSTGYVLLSGTTVVYKRWHRVFNRPTCQMSDSLMESTTWYGMVMGSLARHNCLSLSIISLMRYFISSLTKALGVFPLLSLFIFWKYSLYWAHIHLWMLRNMTSH